MPSAAVLSILAAVCAAAVWFDVRESRIPNALTVGALVVALLLRTPDGLSAVGAGLAGAGIAFAIALPFFLVGGMGGGDAKLLAAVGGFLGTDRVFTALLLTALIGGVMGIFVMLRRGAVAQTAANLRTIFMTLGSGTFTGWKRDGESKAAVTLETPGVLTVPYGIAISAGALLAWFL